MDLFFFTNNTYLSIYYKKLSKYELHELSFKLHVPLLLASLISLMTNHYSMLLCLTTLYYVLCWKVVDKPLGAGKTMFY